jgi:hypothetical protein
MVWREWPAWKKGGLIAPCINLSLYLIGIILDRSFSFGTIESWGFFFKLPASMMYEGFNEILNLRLTQPFSIVVALIISLIGYFIVGAIIGWIIGKIKNRNNPTPKQ